MSFERFAERVGTCEELAAIVGTPSQLAIRKELTALDGHMRQFIANSPFLVIATHSASGLCDASPRGDAPGFVQVIDDRMLLIPDRLGNRRVDSFRNVIETGRVGLLFLVPGVGETLRVNGKAMLIRDERWLTPMTVQGKRPLLALAVEVEECYLQCAKALIRSGLWTSHRPDGERDLPCAAEMFVAHAKMPEMNVAEMQKLLDEAYEKRLY